MEYLEALDLTVNEAKVVNALISHGQADAKTLSQNTSLQRRVVYDILDKLSKLGLVAGSTQNDKTFFSLALESYLVSLAEKEREKEIAIKELIKMNNTNIIEEARPKANLFFGIKPLRQLLLAQITSGNDYMSLGAAKKSLDLMGPHFWLTYNQRQVDLNVRGKIIFNESLRAWSKNIRNPLRSIKFLEAGIEPMTVVS